MEADPGGSAFFVCRVGRRHHLINAKEVIIMAKSQQGQKKEVKKPKSKKK
jgi:hypothetical protein